MKQLKITDIQTAKGILKGQDIENYTIWQIEYENQDTKDNLIVEITITAEKPYTADAYYYNAHNDSEMYFGDVTSFYFEELVNSDGITIDGDYYSFIKLIGVM